MIEPAMSSSSLWLWRDLTPRSGVAHMALDEALLRLAPQPVLRAYHWEASELTIGFFTPQAAVADSPLPVTRRWTGGGVVEHGSDLTFALAIPRPCLPPLARAADRYREIHEAVASALRDAGYDRAVPTPSTRPDPVQPGFCFAAPVAWDLLDRDSGEKIAGGAQRLGRSGLLHQGSIRLPAPWSRPDHAWLDALARRLSPDGICESPPQDWLDAVHALADSLAGDRYAQPDWLGRR